MKVIGIDLAGVPERPTGFALIDKKLNSQTKNLFTDKELIEETLAAKPDLVSIDAPLGLPLGRCCFEKNCKCFSLPFIRKAEKELIKRGIRVFPCGFMGMQKLTLRGIKLKNALKKKKLKVIESYPGSIQDILGIPRKNKGIEELRKGLIKYGFKGDVFKEKISDHELDAITSALVGKLFLENKTIALGDPREECIVVPSSPKQTTLKRK